MKGMEILVLEDDLATLNMISAQLASDGYRVTRVADGRSALDACRGRPPDLVVCDLGMTGLDGYEVIRRFREERFRFPIVVVTGLGPEKTRAALDAGADAFLEKPVDRELLAETVERELLKAAPHGHAARRHVLVYEDEPLAHRLLKTMLEPAGYRVTAVENASAALETVEEDPPDLVICDLVVPGVDGIGMIRMLRTDYGFPGPILVVSGHAGEKTRKAALEAGANGFIAKPAERADLLAAVERLIAGRRAGG